MHYIDSGRHLMQTSKIKGYKGKAFKDELLAAAWATNARIF